jgi:hypothetical protein
MSIPRGIELTINNRYSFTGDRENYQTRARKLIFNLKKNKVTPPSLCSRSDVCAGYPDEYLGRVAFSGRPHHSALHSTRHKGAHRTAKHSP